MMMLRPAATVSSPSRSNRGLKVILLVDLRSKSLVADIQHMVLVSKAYPFLKRSYSALMELVIESFARTYRGQV